MAFYSQQCVDCTEATKRCSGEYHGKDESGVPFSGTMYQCDNLACSINCERQRTQRQLQAIENRNDGARPLSSGTRRHRRY